jgi:5-carboxymethyl-2-hydroxymuconate isomerase
MKFSMPHQIIEYSKNLEDRLDIRGLVEALHRRAADLEALPLAGLRTRAFAAEHYAIADRHQSNGYIAVYLRIGQGRTDAVKEATGKALYECLCDFTATLFDSSPVALSYEVQEIDPVLRWNKNNLREYIAQRTGAVSE